ncbi:L,D-transpeptidase catalytic domain [Litoreibacter ascidiaceicola]|uniref:L,D-transpeptidase catalytic domain n=1 Tax=Litoreibacter ascidiaceicola TaxID=1486859 RepID=A0A1M5BZP8_9RHOB|nr:L,D-transpeptidase [Litoreibacter ascidiaceicola]SHF47672.1 L,D-transpeptidase catalytic domain [Litoreibacter ascidiaceicola]
MSKQNLIGVNRRHFLLSAGAAASSLAVPAFAQNGADTTENERDLTEVVRRNMSSFRSLTWQPHFSNLRNGAILVDIDSRALHMWTEDGNYSLYPSSVPLSEDLTRRGRTSIVRKVDGPTWSPTPAMKKRNPEWPDFVPAGPDNPLGTHALYLGWTYYRIHGTHDTRKIGRRSSNGCIGLFNEHIAEVFAKAKVGTQVLLI